MEKQTDPEIIYHYTTQDGLLGILKEGALWATKIHYVSDASELIEPLRIADLLVTKLARQFDAEGIKDKQLKKDVTRRMLGDISDWGQTNICVASFCTNGDLLSQWRGYGVPGSAYAIGFNREKLADTMKPHPFELLRCNYFDPGTYRQTIHQFILEVFEEAIKTRSMPEDFIGRFIRMAAIMKFKCFEEEDEWRIVSWKPVSFTDGRFNFKSGNSMIVPYYSLPLNLDSIVEIIVGPCQHPELAQSAVYGLAYKFNLENIKPGKVKTSQIPYRVF